LILKINIYFIQGFFFTFLKKRPDNRKKCPWGEAKSVMALESLDFLALNADTTNR